MVRFDLVIFDCDGVLADSEVNRIPDDIRAAFVEFAPDHEDLTPHELAVKYTDEKRYFCLNPRRIAFPRRKI